MTTVATKPTLRFVHLLMILALVALSAAPVAGAGYDSALKGVTEYKAVFDVSLGDPKIANIIFWAVKNSYEAPEVKGLGTTPHIAVVFHGPAVKLISADMAPFNAAEQIEVVKLQETLRQMKEAGVKLEVCLYAAKVMGVDKETIIKDVDRVDNGFVSVIGYQMQGYAVVRIP